jgi:hypothetical protein
VDLAFAMEALQLFGGKILLWETDFELTRNLRGMSRRLTKSANASSERVAKQVLVVETWLRCQGWQAKKHAPAPVKMKNALIHGLPPVMPSEASW